MIKKIIWLAILGIAVYVGYLVWGNLDRNERDAVLGCGGKVVDKTKDVAHKAANAITDKTKEVIHEKVMDKRQPASGTAPATGPTPGGNVIKIPAEAPNQAPPVPAPSH